MFGMVFFLFIVLELIGPFKLNAIYLFCVSGELAVYCSNNLPVFVFFENLIILDVGTSLWVF